jgi:hypothetical protein
MKSKMTDPHICINLIGAIILLVGLGSSILIYQTAGDDSNSALSYHIGSGSVYSIKPEDSKIYRHDLELYGGKAGVLADQFRRWFVGLWYGKSLAFTVACITVLISSGFFLAAHNLTGSTSRRKSDAPFENNRDGTS